MHLLDPSVQHTYEQQVKAPDAHQQGNCKSGNPVGLQHGMNNGVRVLSVCVRVCLIVCLSTTTRNDNDTDRHRIINFSVKTEIRTDAKRPAGRRKTLLADLLVEGFGCFVNQSCDTRKSVFLNYQ
jgi:hypothetical protein